MSGTKNVNADLASVGQRHKHNWTLAEEVPIAIRINGETYAIMLATPLDLADFVRGFCLSEGLIKSTDVILSIQQKAIKDGVEININLTDQAFDRIQIIDRRRRLAGASGCGVCGLTSLSHIVEELPKIESNQTISISSILKAKQDLHQHTPLNRVSHSVHAAAFANADGNIILAREDVGRHNALDKLIGAITAQNIDIKSGFVLLTSRFAYEMAQKCIRLGVPIVTSISAPTTMAVEMAKNADMTFAAFAGDEELMIFSNPERLR